MRQKRVQTGFFFGLLLLVTLAFLGLIQDFLLPLFWAVVLATLFYPLQKRWQRALGGRRTVTAGLTLLVILLVVILPLFLVGLIVTRESIDLYERIASGEIDLQEAVRFVERTLPVVTGYLEGLGVEIEKLREGLSNVAVTASQLLASRALAIGQNALQFTVGFFVMLYVLFFFLRDGEALVEGLIRALPLGDVRERHLLSKFVEVARATIKGTLVVGLVQGTLGGLLFWILGVPAPAFWGMIMTLLSLLPAVGAAVIWGPAAIIFLVTGEILKGLVLIAGGMLLVGLADNVLRPLLVGRDTQMPDYLILLATLGGLTVFGLSGVVIGPIIAAFFLVVWEMFAEEFAEETENVRG